MGKRQELEMLINKEALLLAKFLRNEKREWTPPVNEFIKFGDKYRTDKGD